METALWITQVLLAAIFFATGLTKLTQPRLKLAAGPMSWAAGEFERLAVPIILLALCLFVAVERFAALTLS
jgi:hypothetical protein